MKTALHTLIDELKAKKATLTPKGIIRILENNLYKEKNQIWEAFQEGYEGGSDFHGFDYPHARYYNDMYEDTAAKLNAQQKKLQIAADKRLLKLPGESLMKIHYSKCSDKVKKKRIKKYWAKVRNMGKKNRNKLK